MSLTLALMVMALGNVSCAADCDFARFVARFVLAAWHCQVDKISSFL